MSNTISWTEQNEPVGLSIDQLLYRIRSRDEGGLIFDGITMAEILDDEGVERYALDALVFTYSLLRRKMEVLERTMSRAGSDLDVLSTQVSDPFKRNGVAQVASIFELSDGQTVTVYFHNPDNSPGRLAPKDQMVSWKWLLNKRDITIVVAPERGNDIAIREVARRVMKLAAKNSKAFAKANAKRAERLEKISGMKDEIASLELELSELNSQIEVAKVEAEAEALKPIPTADEGMSALNSIKKFISRGQYRTISKAMRGEEKNFFIDKAKLLANIINGMAETYEQDGKGMDATAYLHYFKSGSEWYITEKDSQGGTKQAFGYSDLGNGGELGYISIDELTKGEVELDLYFDPTTLSAVTANNAEPDGAKEDKLADAKGMISKVAAEFKGQLSDWKQLGEAQSETPDWEYADLRVGGIGIKVGASLGGVVSLDGKPHDEEGRVIDSADSLRSAITALLPEAESSWELSKESVSAMDDEEFKREINELEDQNLRSQSLLLLAKRKGTDEQINAAQSILEQHDQEGSASPELIERREALRQEIDTPKSKGSSDAGNGSDIDSARSATDLNPTDEQKETGNYDKGELSAFGLDLVIENPKGAIRSGKSSDGSEWSVSMAHDYGYIKGTKGLDGDEVDVFIGPNLDGDSAYVINQVDQDGQLYEHKVMLGFDSEESARQGYLSSFNPGWDGLGSIKEMSLDELKAWLPNASNGEAKVEGQGQGQDVDLPEPQAGAQQASPEPDSEQASYYYGLRARPAGPGAVPGGSASTMSEDEALLNEQVAPLLDGRDYRDYRHGVISYDRKLTDKEIYDFELIDLNAVTGDTEGNGSIDPSGVSVGDTVVWRNDNGELEGTYRGYMADQKEAVIVVNGMQMTAPISELFKVDAPKEQGEAPVADEPEISSVPEPSTPTPEQESQYQRLSKLMKAAPKQGEAIKSDDPDAIPKLTAKLEYLQAFAALMRDANKLVRKGDIEGLKRMGFSEELAGELMKPDFANRKGFPPYRMSNNSAEVGRTKRRLNKLISEQAAPVAPEPEATPIPQASEPEQAEQPVAPTVEADPVIEDEQSAEPVAEGSQKQSDLSLLESVINGTVEDILSPELGDQIAEVVERNIEDEGMSDLLEKAVMAYQSAMEQATAEL